MTACPLSLAAETFPQIPAIVFGPRTITYGQLDQYVGASVKYLKKIGLQPGERVAIVDHNTSEYVILLLALWRFGATACLLNPHAPEDFLNESLTKLKASLLLTSVKNVLASPKIRIRRFRLDEMINFDIRDVPLSRTHSLSLEQEATLLLTSGSQGEPKPALHTYGNHHWSALGANAAVPIGKSDRWLLSLPLYHVSGLGILFRTLLSGAGAALVIPGEEDLPSDIVKYGITHISLVATQLYRILQHAPAGKRSAQGRFDQPVPGVMAPRLAGLAGYEDPDRLPEI